MKIPHQCYFIIMSCQTQYKHISLFLITKQSQIPMPSRQSDSSTGFEGMAAMSPPQKSPPPPPQQTHRHTCRSSHSQTWTVKSRCSCICLRRSRTSKFKLKGFVVGRIASLWSSDLVDISVSVHNSHTRGTPTVRRVRLIRGL